MIEYAADGSTFSTLATDQTSPYIWTVPTVNTSASRLRITITDVAGNGNSASYQGLGVDARTTAMYDYNWWEMDPASGDIYARYHWHGMARLNRGTGMWERVVGGGANEYWNNDGQSGSNRIANRHMLIIGIDDQGRVLTNNMKWNGRTL